MVFVCARVCQTLSDLEQEGGKAEEKSASEVQNKQKYND